MITSTSNGKIKELLKLKQKKYRDASGCYLVEGIHLVEEALKAEVVTCLISTKEITTKTEVLLVSQEVMKKLAFTKTPQSIMAVCKMKKQSNIKKGNRYLLFDSLQDPGNIGTLIRTALAFNIDQVILSKDCVDIYNDKVLRSMQGAHFHISCIYQALEEVIPLLQKEDVYVVGTALEGGIPIDTLVVHEKMAYIVGNEGNGMHKDIMNLCDSLAYIPINTIESLNVSIAGSIMMYHFKQ